VHISRSVIINYDNAMVNHGSLLDDVQIIITRKRMIRV
jgi:hypothetical protein